MRQIQVVTLAAEGLNNQRIAGVLNISETSTRRHLCAAGEVLGGRGRAHVVAQAFRAGLLDLDPVIA